uniref:UDP-glucuronic acid decarboxylase 1 n=2 Tax=Zea mays TaxID=4577 RepID=A0A804Q128_MAIZE
MLSLLFIGIRLEQQFGFVRIGAIYLLSGFGGSVLSALFLRNSYISVGASGALFGLLGSMLSELLMNWTIYSNKAIHSVGSVALKMVEEVHRQFNTILGLMEGTGKPDYATYVKICTDASINEMIPRDVTEPLLVEVDQIYHLACPASPIFYKHNSVKTIKTNVIGTLNMLGLAKRVGARILLTSTSEVYGDPLEHPQIEAYWGNVNPIGVRSCYDEGKRVAETLMFDYHRQHGIEIRIARIFNTYGPRMNIDDGRVVSNFIAQAVR